MALRAITVMQELCAEMEEVCPGAWIFNYTNPVNLVAAGGDAPLAAQDRVALRGADLLPDQIARGLPSSIPSGSTRDDGRAEPRLLERRARPTTARDAIPLIRAAWERRRDDPALDRRSAQLRLAATMELDPRRLLPVLLLPDEVAGRAAGQADDARRGHPGLVDRLLGALRGAGRERRPQLDPARSRGGIHELELAIDVMDAIFNDKDEVHPVNVPNAGGACPGSPRPGRRGARPLQRQGHRAAARRSRCRAHVAGS